MRQQRSSSRGARHDLRRVTTVTAGNREKPAREKKRPQCLHYSLAKKRAPRVLPESKFCSRGLPHPRHDTESETTRIPTPMALA